MTKFVVALCAICCLSSLAGCSAGAKSASTKSTGIYPTGWSCLGGGQVCRTRPCPKVVGGGSPLHLLTYSFRDSAASREYRSIEYDRQFGQTIRLPQTRFHIQQTRWSQTQVGVYAIGRSPLSFHDRYTETSGAIRVVDIDHVGEHGISAAAKAQGAPAWMLVKNGRWYCGLAQSETALSVTTGPQGQVVGGNAAPIIPEDPYSAATLFEPKTRYVIPKDVAMIGPVNFRHVPAWDVRVTIPAHYPATTGLGAEGRYWNAVGSARADFLIRRSNDKLLHMSAETTLTAFEKHVPTLVFHELVRLSVSNYGKVIKTPQPVACRHAH